MAPKKNKRAAKRDEDEVVTYETTRKITYETYVKETGKNLGFDAERADKAWKALLEKYPDQFEDVDGIKVWCVKSKTTVIDIM